MWSFISELNDMTQHLLLLSFSFSLSFFNLSSRRREEKRKVSDFCSVSDLVKFVRKVRQRFGLQAKMMDRVSENETNSGVLSDVTARDFNDREEISGSGFQMANSTSTEWTDEKHSSYLNSIEASFVKQLYNDEYNLMDLVGSRSRRENLLDSSSFQHLNANKGTTSGQFKVLHDGCWKKIDFKRAPQQLDSVNNSYALPDNLWIQHFKSREKHEEVVSPILKEFVASCIEATPLASQPASSSKVPPSASGTCQDSEFSYTEVSDQNFVDEEKEPLELSSYRNSKRKKPMDASLSTKDQVVPNGMFPITTDSKESGSSMEKKHARTNYS